jgi:hypothetical protein
MATQIFKANGLKVRKIHGDFNNNFSGRINSIAYGLFNTAGEIFALNGKPYHPIGGAAAFRAIVEDGLNHEGYSFIKYNNFGTLLN